MREHVLCEKGELHARTHRDGELPVDLEGVLYKCEKESARQKEKKEKKEKRKRLTEAGDPALLDSRVREEGGEFTREAIGLNLVCNK